MLECFMPSNKIDKQLFIDVLKEVATKKDIRGLQNQMKKDKKELLSAIANVAINSPTLKQFYKLEEKVDSIRTS